MLKAVGEGGVDLARQLVEAVFSSDEISADWEERVTLGRGNYPDLKITDEVMKLLVQVLDFYICKKVNIDKMQYSLLSGRANTYTIFVVHQLQKKYIAVKKMLYFAIINHEKVFDHVFRKAQWWALRSLGVEEWASVSRNVSTEACTLKVLVSGQYSEEFGMGIAVHPGSVLSPLFSIMVLEMLLCEFHTVVLWEFLYADDLDTLIGYISKFKASKAGMGSKGLLVNMKVGCFLLLVGATLCRRSLECP